MTICSVIWSDHILPARRSLLAGDWQSNSGSLCRHVFWWAGEFLLRQRKTDQHRPIRVDFPCLEILESGAERQLRISLIPVPLTHQPIWWGGGGFLHQGLIEKRGGEKWRRRYIKKEMKVSSEGKEENCTVGVKMIELWPWLQGEGEGGHDLVLIWEVMSVCKSAFVCVHECVSLFLNETMGCCSTEYGH